MPMKTLRITQLTSDLLKIFEDCQTDDFLITRWGKPWIVLIGEIRAWNMHLQPEIKREFPEGVPIFVVILLGKESEEQE